MNVTSAFRARWIGAAALTVALASTFALTGTAHAAAPVTPSYGPTAGGSSVTIVTPQVTIDTLNAGFVGAFFSADTGEAFSWGAGFAQFSSAGDANAPVQISAPSGVHFTRFGSSSSFAMALGDDGNLYGSGQNTFGQLGDGSFTSQTLSTVTLPSGVTGFTDFALGQSYVLAMGDDGVLYSWGAGGSGQLGNGNSINSNVPVAVFLPLGVNSFTQFAAGKDTSYALGDDGVLYAWGSNASYALGAGPAHNGTNQVTIPIPVALPGGTAVAKIVATYSNAFALDENGVLYSWGSDANGALGTGGQSDVYEISPVSTPAPVLFPAGVSAYSEVSTSTGSIFVLGDDLKWYSWGHNGYFQLDASGISRSVPGPVPTPTGVDFIEVVGGGYTSYAIGSDGLLYSWGLNGSGQGGVGNDDTLLRVPTKVKLQHAAVSADFGGAAATNVSNAGAGTFTAVTPAHVAGQVDVTVGWTLNGFAMTPVVYAASFLYTDVPPAGPTITTSGPTTVNIKQGGSHTFALTVTEGDSAITAEPVVTSADGVEANVTVTATGVSFDSEGLAPGRYQFTVTWTDDAGIAASQLFTVNVADPNSADDNQDNNHKLPNTGSAEVNWLGTIGGFSMLLGSVVVLIAARRRQA